MSIEIAGVSKAFGAQRVLKDVSLSLPGGELTALLGPSGCGKTTLLRILAGLEAPDAGEVRVAGEAVTDRSARERNVGLVFQHYALFRHMTVGENVAFPLAVRRRPAAEVRERVQELLSLVRLEGLAGRYPAQLSGGQRQRVALARALATQPSVLLLDEPFGALDARVREELRRWLRRLHDELHVTSVFVTHDQEEAFEVSDRVVVMNEGRVEQVGTPAQVFEEPASSFVMRFLGAVNVFRGRVDGGRAYVGDLELAAPGAGARATHAHVHIYVRPHELEIGRARVPGSFAARVERVVTLGTAVRVELARPLRRAARGRARPPPQPGAGPGARRSGRTSPRAGCGSSPAVTRSWTRSPPASSSRPRPASGAETLHGTCWRALPPGHPGRARLAGRRRPGRERPAAARRRQGRGGDAPRRLPGLDARALRRDRRPVCGGLEGQDRAGGRGAAEPRWVRQAGPRRARRPGGGRGDPGARLRRRGPGEGGAHPARLAAPAPRRCRALHLDHRLPRAQGQPQGHPRLGRPGEAGGTGR